MCRSPAASRETLLPMIRVSIVEDNAALRAELRRLVETTEGFDFRGEYASAEAALACLAADRPDVVLMDVHLPGMNGVEAVRRLKSAMPDVQVVMLTVFEHNDWIFDALRAGANGYVLKKSPRPEIVDAIRQVHGGGAPMSSSVARKVVQFFSQRPDAGAGLSELTDREHVVLQKLSEGLSYEEIGVALAISINTVRKHIRGIYEKLQVNSRTEAVARLLRQ
jgi:DNA-binding NarL/FixJ family response regulator